jgi:broad specificity phosphatase PhoE
VPTPAPWFRTAYKSFYKARWNTCREKTSRDVKFLVRREPTASTVTVHFVRHGEGIHNVLAASHQAAGNTQPPYGHEFITKYPQMIDAPLTLKGINEAKANAVQSPFLEPQPDYLVTSPLQRAVVTGLVSFNFSRPKNEGRVVAHEGAREAYHSRNICDLRRNLAEIKMDFPFIDFSNIEDDEPEVEHVGIDGESVDSVVDRLHDFLVWLSDDMSKASSTCVAVASHSVALFALTNGVLHFEEGIEEGERDIFGTGEMRTFHIEKIGQADRLSA